MVKPALLVVDMQNDFVREGAPMEVPDARKTITQNKALIAYCRQAGIPVIFTRFIGTTERSLLWNWSPKIAPPLRACNKGYKRYYADVKQTLECTDVVDELSPKDGEVIIDKYGYGAFHETRLDSILKAMGVQSLILTGTVTQICVEETGREAFHYGYKTTMVTDAVSSFMPDLHAAAIKNFGMKFGWCKTADEVLAMLRGSH
jgi:nicotinamidase-related amidase